MTDASDAELSTADLVDKYGSDIQSCDVQFQDLGGRTRFSGGIATFRSPADNLIVKDIVSEPGDGRVLVIDAGGSLHGAMVGDNMAARAHSNGWAGLVINGVIRDRVALAKLPIGIKALGSNPRRSAKAGEGERDVDVSFGTTTFHPGDYLVADEDGIVVLPG